MFRFCFGFFLLCESTICNMLWLNTSFSLIKLYGKFSQEGYTCVGPKFISYSSTLLIMSIIICLTMSSWCSVLLHLAISAQYPHQLHQRILLSASPLTTSAWTQTTHFPVESKHKELSRLYHPLIINTDLFFIWFVSPDNNSLIRNSLCVLPHCDALGCFSLDMQHWVMGGKLDVSGGGILCWSLMEINLFL